MKNFSEFFRNFSGTDGVTSVAEFKGLHPPFPPRFPPTINPANNHITTSGYTYDAAGNMTNDSFHTYTYDAEGNITQVDGGSTAQYVYDVFNRRIHVQTPSATTEYTYDYAGRRISSWLSPNNTGVEGRIYWDGQQLGFRSSDGTTYFDHQDTLGTRVYASDGTGTLRKQLAKSTSPVTCFSLATV